MILFSPVTVYTSESSSVAFLRSHAFPCLPFLFLLITLKNQSWGKKQPKKKKKTDFGLSFNLLERF